MSPDDSPGDTAPAPDDPGMLVLAPYRSHLEIVKYPDSRVLKANCGHHAWLSPQGEAYLDRCYTLCEDCAADIVEDPNPEGKALVRGAIDHIRRLAGDRAADEAERYARQHGWREDAGDAFRRPD